MAALEARVIRDCHVMLFNATKTCCTSVAGDLFQEYLITEDVKTAMTLNIPDQEKAEKLIDCVRAQVASTPEKINVFISVLHRNGIEDAAKRLEELLKEKETTPIDQPETKTQPKKSVPKNQEFPYLSFGSLAKNDREDLVTKLVNEYTTIKMKFAVLVDNTLQSLKAQNISLEKLKVVIKTYLSEKEMLKLFKNMKSLQHLFMKDYWSFFDYELIAVIIESHCKELKPLLAEYVAIFNEYCKRRCSEVPTDFMSKTAGKKYYTLTVKISKELDQMRMKDVKELERQLKLFTNQDFVLSHFEDGCIELIFISLSEEGDISAISDEHKEELFQMSVLKIYSANCVYYDNGESSPSGAQLSHTKKLMPSPNLSQQEIQLICDAVKESNKVEDLAAALGMSDCLEDADGDVEVLLQQWQERAGSANQRSHLLYYLARIDMQDLHENLFSTDSHLLMEMKSELESLRSMYQQTIEENHQLKNELQKEKSSYHQSLEEKNREIAYLKMKLEQENLHRTRNALLQEDSLSSGRKFKENEGYMVPPSSSLTGKRRQQMQGHFQFHPLLGGGKSKMMQTDKDFQGQQHIISD